MARTTFTGPIKSLNGFETSSGATLSDTEIERLDGVTAGTVTASKAVVVDANKDISAFRNVVVTNIDAGASATAGSVDVFPTTAAKGKLSITAADSAGDTTTTVVNASQSGARTYTIPDAGASASFVLSTGTSTGISATSTELNTLSGIKATTAELNLHNTLDATNVETWTANGANTFTLTKRIHKIDTTAGAQTCTPAAPGAANLGVVHVIEMTVDGGTDCVITLTNFDTGNGFATSTATFNDVGDYMIVIGGVSKWHILDSKATHA